MKLLLLVGSSAVGKMTVGQELMKITDLRLFHNHMAIDLVLEVFGRCHKNTIERLRDVIFEAFTESDQYGMIFTYMWAFDDPADWDYINHVCAFFQKKNAELYCAELTAPQAIRLERNATGNRLAHKPSKRDIPFSTQMLLNDDRTCRSVSKEGEIPFEHYIRIDNSQLPPGVAAQMIKDAFLL
ncbi:MAG: AAA family ATPase [Firmicutes bacterium]|nr:AAA family ATPase [Bacillota bacterium]